MGVYVKNDIIVSDIWSDVSGTVKVSISALCGRLAADKMKEEEPLWVVEGGG